MTFTVPNAQNKKVPQPYDRNKGSSLFPARVVSRSFLCERRHAVDFYARNQLHAQPICVILIKIVAVATNYKRRRIWLWIR